LAKPGQTEGLYMFQKQECLTPCYMSIYTWQSQAYWWQANQSSRQRGCYKRDTTVRVQVQLH
jgi:predicted deacetylase